MDRKKWPGLTGQHAVYAAAFSLCICHAEVPFFFHRQCSQFRYFSGSLCFFPFSICFVFYRYQQQAAFNILEIQLIRLSNNIKEQVCYGVAYIQ